MATAQGFIQPIAQAAQTTIPNNGNPNTVYNVAPTGAAAGNTGWVQAPVTPAANYSGVNVGDAIAQSNEQLKTQGWVAPAADPNATPAGQGLITLPQGWAEEIKNFQPKTTEQVNQGSTGTGGNTTAPTYDLNKQWIVMDGNVPRKNPQLYASDEAYRAAWDQIFAEHQSRMGKSIEDRQSGADSMAAALKSYYQMYYDNGWRPDSAYTGSQGKTGNVMGTNSWLDSNYYSKTDPKGWERLQQSKSTPNSVGGGGGSSGVGGDGRTVNGIDLGAVAGMITNSGGATSNRGWNSDTSKGVGENLSNYFNNAVNSLTSSNTAGNIMNVLDKLTEPFLPGNLYMSELGKVNMPNVVSAIMNQVVPGLGTLGKWIADKIPQDAGGLLGKIRDFFQQGKFQEAANQIYKDYDMEKAQQNAITGGGGGGGGDGWVGGGNAGYGGWGGWGGVPVVDGRGGVGGGVTWIGHERPNFELNAK